MFVRFNELKRVDLGNFNFVPIDCPVCKLMMKKTDVHSSFLEHGCCESCFYDFVEANSEKWKTGWRPENTEIDRVLQKRAKLPSYIMRGYDVKRK